MWSVKRKDVSANRRVAATEDMFCALIIRES